MKVDSQIEAEYTQQRFERRKLTRYAQFSYALFIFAITLKFERLSSVIVLYNGYLTRGNNRAARKKAHKKPQQGSTLMRFMQEKEYWEKFIDAMHIGDFGDLPPKREISFFYFLYILFIKYLRR
jgi:hypothetical protein